jgi:PadR family transcriptional regulator, regulatory protein PadR
LYRSFRTGKGAAGDVPLATGGTVNTPAQPDLMKGMLDMLVLQSLQLGPMHGWGITELLERRSGDVLHVGQGSLYPALYRLERQGFVESAWQTTQNNRRARYYSLTPAGRARLAEERANWRRLAGAVNLVLGMEGA